MRVKHPAPKSTHKEDEFWVSKKTNKKQMVARCTKRLESGKI